MRITPLRAIRKHCLDCCGNSSMEVELCTDPDCFLYPHRFGKRLAKEIEYIKDSTNLYKIGGKTHILSENGKFKPYVPK